MRNPTANEVDTAVRSALAEIGRARGRIAAAKAVEADVFAGRLLGLRDAEALAGSCREVRIAPGTVVTPLAFDALKKRGIAIRLVSEREARRSRAEGTWGFAIDDASGAASALRRALLDDRDGWRELGPAEAPAWVSDADDRGAVLITPDAALAVWEAHRFRDVRAAAVSEVRAVARAVRTLGASLLVVEPEHKSIYALRQICATFRRGGAPMPPPGASFIGGSGQHEDRRGDRSGDALAYAPELAQRPLPGRPADAPRGPRFGLIPAR